MRFACPGAAASSALGAPRAHWAALPPGAVASHRARGTRPWRALHAPVPGGGALPSAPRRIGAGDSHRGRKPTIGVGNLPTPMARCLPQCGPAPAQDLLVGLVLIGAPVEARPRAARRAASVVGRAPGAGLRGSQGLRPALLPLLRCGAVAPMRKFLCHPGASSCGCWSRPCARGGLLVQGWESASHSQIVFDLGAPRGCRTT